MSPLVEELERQAGRDSSGSCLESARDARVVSRAELPPAVERWRSRLDAASVPAGARIGIRGGDPLLFAVSWLGIIGAGRVAAPIGPDLAGEGLARWRREVSPWTIVDADAQTLAGEGELASVTEGADGPAGLLLSSSGTTGPAKLVALREDQLLATARSVIAAHQLTETDRCHNPLPLWHINAEVVAVLGALLSGGCVVLDDRFHRTGYWQLVAERGITWLNAVPAILAILAREEDTPLAGSRLRFARSASAPLPPTVQLAFEKRTGIPVVQTYGMTEAGSQITAEDLPTGAPRQRPLGSVGRPVGVELRVVGDDQRELPAGEAGHVQIRGAGVVTSYASAAGAENFTADGWLDTRDSGRLDPDGWLYLDGRSDDIINRGGEKISPLHVEDVLLSVEGVGEVAVVGLPDDVLGMVPVAVVVPTSPEADGKPPEELVDRVLQRAAEALPRISRPVRVHLVESLGNGVNGKVSRKAVLARLVDAGLEAPSRQAAAPSDAPRAR